MNLDNLVPKNIDYERCIDNIPHGREILRHIIIPNHYTLPNPVFTRSKLGDFWYSIPPIQNDKPKYIAAFDLDWTLTANQYKLYPFSADPEDIILLPDRREILTSLVKRGYILAVFTNQKCKNAKKRLDRVTVFLKDLGLPCFTFVSTGDDNYRKPKIGMWEVFREMVGGDIKYAFYVGDAAGRPEDFSDADILFARNANVQFYTPEEFFPCQSVLFTENLIVLVGAPGTGKSYIADVYKKAGYKIISRDELGGNKNKYLKSLEKSIAIYPHIVADATNGVEADRDVIYEMARKNNRTIKVIYLLRNGHGWNKLRNKPVPDVAYHIYYNKVTPPTGDNVQVVTDPCI